MQAEVSARLPRRSRPPQAKYCLRRLEDRSPARLPHPAESTRRLALCPLRALPEGLRQLFPKLVLQTNPQRPTSRYPAILLKILGRKIPGPIPNRMRRR